MFMWLDFFKSQSGSGKLYLYIKNTLKWFPCLEVYLVATEPANGKFRPLIVNIRYKPRVVLIYSEIGGCHSGRQKYEGQKTMGIPQTKLPALSPNQDASPTCSAALAASLMRGSISSCTGAAKSAGGAWQILKRQGIQAPVKQNNSGKLNDQNSIFTG